MKTIYEKTLKDGRRHVLIELAKGEQAPVRSLDNASFYQLGYPMDDQVIAGHILLECDRVVWDSLEQRWIK